MCLEKGEVREFILPWRVANDLPPERKSLPWGLGQGETIQIKYKVNFI